MNYKLLKLARHRLKIISKSVIEVIWNMKHLANMILKKSRTVKAFVNKTIMKKNCNVLDEW